MTGRKKDAWSNNEGDVPISRLKGVAGGKYDVPVRLAALKKMNIKELRQEWRKLYRVDAPKRVRRDLLVLGVAWKIQEKEFGGLGPAIKRRLRTIAKEGGCATKVKHDRSARLKPGTRLVREWHGLTHTITVTEDGFLWNDKEWKTLSRVAREITGGHWSGPRFFGLTRQRAQVTVAAAENG